jgi:hypothetical protein
LKIFKKYWKQPEAVTLPKTRLLGLNRQKSSLKVKKFRITFIKDKIENLLLFPAGDFF